MLDWAEGLPLPPASTPVCKADRMRDPGLREYRRKLCLATIRNAKRMLQELYIAKVGSAEAVEKTAGMKALAHYGCAVVHIRAAYGDDDPATEKLSELCVELVETAEAARAAAGLLREAPLPKAQRR